jgi:hypothetical protein
LVWLHYDRSIDECAAIDVDHHPVAFDNPVVLVQPMESGMAETYADIVRDTTCGPAIYGLER